MEKQQGRRNFLKLAGLTAGALQLPLAGWAEGFKTLLNEGINPSGEFSLLKLEKLLVGYAFPFVEQFSTSGFHSGYKLYNLYGDNIVFAGELFIKSETKGENRLFDFLDWRFADNGIKDRIKKFKYIVSGSVTTAHDTTLTPEQWNVFSRIALTENDKPYRGAGLVSQGTVLNGDIMIQTPAKLFGKPGFNQALSWKWGLISVAQQMAEASTPEIQFNMLDEFDIVHPNQKMKNKKQATIDCGGGRLVDFNVFEQTGEGVIPTIYWVDQWNRTVFVVSGMEAYVLNYDK